jgi:hypothetical protein
MSRVKKLYKSYEIEATAFPLRDGGFTVRVSIIKHSGSYVDETQFETEQTFQQETEALDAGIILAQRQIDAGFVPTTVV